MEDQLFENSVWKDSSTSELDNAIEGIEKTLMNKLYESYVSQVYWVVICL